MTQERGAQLWKHWPQLCCDSRRIFSVWKSPTAERCLREEIECCCSASRLEVSIAGLGVSSVCFYAGNLAEQIKAVSFVSDNFTGTN